jgi:hypothetical protein
MDHTEHHKNAAEKLLITCETKLQILAISYTSIPLLPLYFLYYIAVMFWFLFLRWK